VDEHSVGAENGAGQPEPVSSRSTGPGHVAGYADFSVYPSRASSGSSAGGVPGAGDFDPSIERQKIRILRT